MNDENEEQNAEAEFSLPPIKRTEIVGLLYFVGVLELIGSIICLCVGIPYSVLIFISGIVSAFILIGFAKLIESNDESAQRLKRIELLMQQREIVRLEEKVSNLKGDYGQR